jgi:hypothetical protein
MANSAGSTTSAARRPRFYRAHHGQVAIIGVDSGDEAAAAVRFLASDHLTHPVAVDASPDPVAAACDIGNLPQTFVLNSRLQIVQHVAGRVTLADLTSWAVSMTRAGPG